MKRTLKILSCVVMVLLLISCQAKFDESEKKLGIIRTQVYEQLEDSVRKDIDGDWQAASVEVKNTKDIPSQYFSMKEDYKEDKLYVITFKSKNPMMGDHVQLADAEGNIIGYKFRL